MTCHLQKPCGWWNAAAFHQPLLSLSPTKNVNYTPDKVPRCAGFAICGLSVRSACRRQSSASGSKNHRTALYCRQADSACVLSKRITNLSSKMENCDCRSPAELVPLSRWICNPPSPSYCFMKFSSPGGTAQRRFQG